MATENNSNFVQPSILRFSGHYDHWSMLMENFLRSKEYWQVIESSKINQQEKEEQFLKVTTENQAFVQHRSVDRGRGRGRDRGRGYNDRRQQQKPEDNQSWRAKKALELVHSNLCGPITPISNESKKYIITFIDDFSRKTLVYLL
ncbi:hypothetical protein ACOSQ2_032585 [Xanthoceras sorbifolium]